MKKLLVILCVVFIVFSTGAIAFGEEELSNSLENGYKVGQKIIKDGKMYEVVDVFNVPLVNGELDFEGINKKDTMEVKSFGNDYRAELKGTKTWVDVTNIIGEVSSAEKGLIRLDVSESVEYAFNLSAGVSMKVFEAALGMEFRKNETIVRSFTFTSDGKQLYTLVANPRYKRYTYDIWEDDIWKDDYLGESSYSKPVGAHFAVLREA